MSATTTGPQTTAEGASVRPFEIAVPEEDLVELRRRIAAGSGHVPTAQEAAHQLVAAPGMTSLTVIPPCCLGPSLRASTSTG